ncbi:histone-lysine N-methyltransferase SETMAR [Trichonephila clavipes]|nr:histone-lysine N-methyltransferase SETMAR [Trichonephila clavipes]
MVRMVPLVDGPALKSAVICGIVGRLSRLMILFVFDKNKNQSQSAEIGNSVYGVDTVLANYVQFWFRRFRTSIFDVKDAPRFGRPVVENVDKITEIIEIDRHFSSRSNAQELQIEHRTILKHLLKVRLKKKLDAWMSQQLTPKNIMHRISFCKALVKRNEIDQFLKRRVTGDKKMVPILQYCAISDRSQSAVKQLKGDQTRTSSQEDSTVYLAGLKGNNLIVSCFPIAKHEI